MLGTIGGSGRPPGGPPLPVLAALSWLFYDPYARHERARLRLSACPVDHGHRTELCQHGPHLERGRWASPAALHVQLALVGTRGVRPDSSRDHGDPALTHGSTLILDESADEKAGTHNVGASRQYNGRLGKVDVCRVDTCLTYANGGLWAMVDGELFLPEEWFGAAFAQTRQALGIPPDRTFETKIALGLKMVKRVKAKGVPFDLLACDALYGRDSQFRADLAAGNVQYAAQVPADTLV